MKTNFWKTVILVVFTGIILTGALSAQSITVTGKVTDADDGTELIGVSVLIKGTTNGTTTNADGKYTIHVEKGKILVFSYIGYKDQEIVVKKTLYNVSLKPDNVSLKETVVAYGVQRDVRSARADKSVMVAQMEYEVSDYRVANKMYVADMDIYASNEEYNHFSENRFKAALEEPLSTFSIDVDAASYSNMRRFVNQGQMPPKDAIRTEELINYFSYNYAQPTGKDPVRITTEIGACPWNEKHRLLSVGIKAKEIADENLPASNLVFLIDVSGSMYGATRLDLVKSSLKLLVNNLRDKDKVAIVVYAGSAGEVLPSTPGSDKQKIREALDNLTAGGSTAGGAGIQLAYKIAQKNFIDGGNNRIILCTDGDFNVGVSSVSGLESLIEEKRKSGVFLTVLGYGMGNHKDNRMQTLAEKGNGNHAYIDNLQEANKVLVQEFGGTIYTVAKDVKLQLEFNPAHVQAYRLIGYESRLLNKEDFNDDTKDAGEMGAGHVVVALYEIIPTGVESNYTGVDPLKYQVTNSAKPSTNPSKELLTVKLRYKEPNGNESKKIEVAVIDNKGNQTSSDFRFAASVAMFGQLLRDSDFKGEASYDKVITLAKTGLDNDAQGYRREFIRLVETVKGMSR